MVRPLIRCMTAYKIGTALIFYDIISSNRREVRSMDWIAGMQRAINYIENNITEELDYNEIAKIGCSSSYHFQRVFSLLCSYTLGEYIRNRRMTLAGAELATGKIKVLDAAFKYGYDSPDSFAKAFVKFHGITPSSAREPGAKLRAFSRMSIKIMMEGGSIMDYRIEEKPEMILTGYKRRFTGTPAERFEQECDFYVSTRVNQYILKGLAHDCDTSYGIMTNFDDEGYDFYIASLLNEWSRSNLEKELGSVEEAGRFENITVPAQFYVICETERAKYPTMLFTELRKRVVSEWLPSSDYMLAEAPEISVLHWFFPENKDKRYIELWIPVVKKEF